MKFLKKKEDEVDTKVSPKTENKSPNKNQISPNKKKNVKIPNRFSSVTEHHNHSDVFLLNTNTNKDKKIEEEKTKNLLKLVVPEIDILKYFYLKKTVKQIKNVFRYFYDTRVYFLTLEKRALKQSRTDHENKDLTFQTAVQTSHRFRQSADNYRKKNL